MADLSPTVRPRELGLRLRELRNAKNMPVEQTHACRRAIFVLDNFGGAH
jgi:hypothetical protein